MAWHRQDQTSQCLATIPGVGPIAGVSFALKIPDPRAFRSARHFAAWIGITPREELHGRQTQARQDQPPGATKAYAGCSCSAPPRSSSGPTKGFASRRGFLGLLARKPKKARSGRAGQQNGPRHLGHDDQRRGIPASTGGLSPACHRHLTPTGASKDSDSKMVIGSIGGSGQPVGPVGAQTSLLCLEPDPRNPSGPAVNRPHSKGRTYDRNRPEPSQLHSPWQAGGRPHMRSR